jgi:hypothetical protein
MPFRSCASFLAIPLVLAGCASSGNFLQEMQPAALDSAQRRGAFEMDCPTATAELLASEMLQPMVRTFVYSGPERAEYTVGVEGCGKRTSYIVICPDNGSKACFDGGSRTEVQQN